MNSYHKAFLNSFSSENVIGLFSRYKNAHKEITESWGLLEAFKKYAGQLDNWQTNDWHIVVVGDGASPRTGALFAYYTPYEVDSIDPAFNMRHWDEHCKKQEAMGFPVKRLHLHSCSAENVAFNLFTKNICVVWPHSHADMNELRIETSGQRMDIALPCCVPIPENWMVIPHLVYKDPNILSPHRTVHIWKKDKYDG